MQRYFRDFDINQNTIIIDGDDFHHIKNVMRSKVNSELVLCDLSGNCCLASIQSFNEKSLICECKKLLPSDNNKFTIDIAQAIIRRERFEYMLQKSTELGVNKIIPVNMKNCIVKLDGKKEDKKIQRWNTIAKEASEQSHRNKLAIVSNMTTLKSIDYNVYDVILVCYEKENESNKLKSIVQSNKYNKILIVVGPEGGFDQSEVEYLSTLSNSEFVGLGKRILRSETASSYILSVLFYEYEMSD